MNQRAVGWLLGCVSLLLAAFLLVPFFGFFAYSLIVGVGWVWRSVVMRGEDFYGDGDSDDA